MRILPYMTVAPRRQDSIEKTLQSFRSVGFQEPLIIFAEPESPEVDHLGFLTETRVNPEPKGVLLNPYWGYRSVEKDWNDDDIILMVQDDVEFCRGARAHLLAGIYSYPDALLLGYAHGSFIQEAHRELVAKEGWNHLEKWAWGGLCFMVKAPQLRKILASMLMSQTAAKATLGEFPNRHWDSAVCESAQEEEVPIYVHVPSLTEHMGVESTLYEKQDFERRRAYRFIPDY